MPADSAPVIGSIGTFAVMSLIDELTTVYVGIWSFHIFHDASA